MATFGKSVRVYLKDGTTTGIRFVEIVNHTIQSIACPRIKINELYTFSESNKPGIYFLFGNDEATSNTKIYIGEAENILDRLQEHSTKKDFWNEVIFFTSKDDNLTKSHVKYLESKAIQIAFQSKRDIVDNIHQPQPSTLPIADRESMEELLIYIRLLLGIFGKHTLEPISTKAFLNQEETNELKLNVGALKAKAIQTNEGIVVCKGSDAAKESTPNLGVGYQKLREQLISNEIILEDGNVYTFQDDYLFTSPSAAAAIITGYNINGRDTWKDKRGKSLNQIEKEKLESVKSNNIAQALATI